MNQYDADAQSMGFRSSEELAEYQRWAAAKPTQPEETIDDVKQAYALLFKENRTLRTAYEQVRQDCYNLTEKVIPNLREERDALLDKVRDYGGRMTDEQSSTLAELDHAITAGAIMTDFTHHTPRLLTDEDAAADLAGVARPSLPSVGTEDARTMADKLDDLDANPWAASIMLRTLVSERDELASRVREVEGALCQISDMTYDSWTNGAIAKQIADAALASKEHP